MGQLRAARIQRSSQPPADDRLLLKLRYRPIRANYAPLSGVSKHMSSWCQPLTAVSDRRMSPSSLPSILTTPSSLPPQPIWLGWDSVHLCRLWPACLRSTISARSLKSSASLSKGRSRTLRIAGADTDGKQNSRPFSTC